MKTITLTSSLVAGILANPMDCVEGSREASLVAASMAMQFRDGMVLRPRGLMLYFRHTNILLYEGRLDNFMGRGKYQAYMSILKLARTLQGSIGRNVMLCNLPDRVASLFCDGDTEFTRDFDKELYTYEVEQDAAGAMRID